MSFLKLMAVVATLLAPAAAFARQPTPQGAPQAAPLWTVDGIMQAGALGILGALAFYGLRWGIPAIVAQQRAVVLQLQALAAASAVNTRVLADLTAMLIQHDATVRGTNPDVMGTTQELVARILTDANRPRAADESSHAG